MPSPHQERQPRFVRRFPPNPLQAEEHEEEERKIHTNGDDNNEPHLTKSGTIDRRFKGYRDAPLEAARNPNYRRASRGFVDESGMHRTMSGKPDLRFKENRGMDEEEASIAQAKYWLEKRQSHGRQRTSTDSSRRH